jgi:tetratricopeptide (TPR) repeat protein
MKITCGAVVSILGLLAVAANAEPSAEDLYNQGQAAFDHRDFKTAIARWNSAYQLSHLPLLVFNLGQAYQLSGDCPKALSAFEKYIELEPKSEQRSQADGYVTELSAQCAARTDTQRDAQTEKPSEKRPRTGHDMKVAGLVAGGAGVAVFATGLAFGWRAASLGDEVTRDCSTACSWSVEKMKQSDGQRDATIGKVLDFVGVAAIAAGIGIYLYGARDGDHALTIQPHSTGATMSWCGRW